MTDEHSTGSTTSGVDEDRAVRALKDHVAQMAELAVGMVADGTRALLSADQELARAVTERDSRLDKFDIDIETETMRLIAVRQPEGPLLRTLGAVLKIANCVDRVGRLGYDLARNLSTAPVSTDTTHQAHLRQMDERAREMVRQAIHAFVHSDAAEAKAVFAMDDDVDDLNREVQAMLIRLLSQGGPATDRLAHELLATRHLERVGDNACKIAEKAVYAITGERRTEYFPQMAHRITTGHSPPGPFG
jgi:phosphate transport system protein